MLRNILFIGSCLVLLSGCNIAEKAIDNAVDGLKENEQELSTYLQSLTQKAVSSAMEELTADSNYLKLQQHLAGVADTFMLHFSDSLDVTSKELIENLIGPQTNQYLDSITHQLLLSVQKMEGELLDEDIPVFIESLLKEEISRSLQAILYDLQQQLGSPAMGESLAAFRRQLDPQVDSLLHNAIAGLMLEYDNSIAPRLSEAIEQVQGVEQTTKRSAKDLIWLMIGGVAGLIALSALIYNFVWRRRYKTLVKVITRNIDQIKEQETYDELVTSIQEETTLLDLEEPLRYILEEQALLDQNDWKDKDQQVLKILAEELAKAQSNGGQTWDTILQSVMARADKAGLKDHMKSVLNQQGPK